VSDIEILKETVEYILQEVAETTEEIRNVAFDIERQVELIEGNEYIKSVISSYLASLIDYAKYLKEITAFEVVE